MGHSYNNRYNFLKKIKINYFSYKTWRLMYLISLNNVHKTSEKKIWYRSTTIPSMYSGCEILIHSGKKFTKKNVNRWMIGFKAGEFTWNRKLALYKSKQKKK